MNEFPESLVTAELGELAESQYRLTDPIPQLTKLGYGFMSKMEGSNKPALLPLAYGGVEDRSDYARLLEHLASEICHLGDHIAKYGQIQPILIDEQRRIILGEKRVLAVAYTAVKMGRNAAEATIQAQMRQMNDDLRLCAVVQFADNKQQLSAVAEGKFYKSLQTAGMKIKEIAEVLCVERQHVRTRLWQLRGTNDTIKYRR